LRYLPPQQNEGSISGLSLSCSLASTQKTFFPFYPSSDSS